MQILEHYDMVGKFDFICGSEFDGTRSKKYEVVQACLEHFGVTDTETVRMIGDRKYDILGAAKCGVKTIGVSFGYAEPGELEQYGAECIADTAEELRDCILQLRS
jgi:phosphoglycolate phosphatase